ncbi:MAG: hypothetical protein K5924_04290 [Chloroflexi bacterium]|nr:hypothetical protein [Chloroflexota bacterium]
MLPSLAAFLLLVGGFLPPAADPPAIAVVPDERDTVNLPDAAILQTLVADLDGDGAREVLRLVRGPDDEALVEAWAQGPAGWVLVDDPLQVVPPSRIGTRIDPVYLATPVRMLLRRIDGVDRVTVASQPHFEEIDVGDPCCLVLEDVVLGPGGLDARSVAEAIDFSDAILAIDLDGDGTDELLTTRSLPPLGDIEFPTEARVHRWDGSGFLPPTVTRLTVGSGHAPRLLGDSDGLPGDEAMFVSGDPGVSGVFRVRLDAGDLLATDGADLPATDAIAFPATEGDGVALVGPTIGFAIAPWPAGEGVGEPTTELTIADGRIVGVAAVDGPRVVVHEPRTESLRLVGAPAAAGPAAVTVTRSPAAARLEGGPLVAYSGPIPGGGADGAPAVIHQGRLIPSPFAGPFDESSLIASLAGAQPVGLAGPDRDLIVLDHAPIGFQPPIDPAGGSLLVPPVRPASWTSIVPVEVAGEREHDDGLLEPPIRDARVVDGRGAIAVGRAGFVAEVGAPAGSRVYVVDGDPSVVRSPIVVPDGGRVDAPFPPPNVVTPDARYRAVLLVQTPAGHAYQATWDVRVRTDPPPLAVGSSTPFGSGAVEISGTTQAGAEVRVDGQVVEPDADGGFRAMVEVPPWPTDVTIDVDDGLGNLATRNVTVIGWFDYRGLPWVPISAALVAVVGVVLFLRVPRAAPLPRREDDDAVYEEIDPDDDRR